MKDPVCGMELNEGRVRESLVYKERGYFFCSAGCLAEFRRHPEDYAESPRAEGAVKRDV